MNSAADLTELRKAVAFIPAHNRETWIKIGMAIKSELGEGGFELWDSWSKTADNYVERNARTTWRSLSNEGGVRIGTLFREAQRHGFCFHGEGRRPRQTAEESVEIDRSAREAELEREAKQTKAAAEAGTIWQAAKIAPGDHPYLMLKGVASQGLRIHHDGHLVIPLNKPNTPNRNKNSMQLIMQPGRRNVRAS